MEGRIDEPGHGCRLRDHSESPPLVEAVGGGGSPDAEMGEGRPEAVQAGYRGEGVVDARREGPYRDLDELVDRELRVQVVVMSSRIPMADFALLAFVEVEAAAGKKSLLPFGLVRQ